MAWKKIEDLPIEYQINLFNLKETEVSEPFKCYNQVHIVKLEKFEYISDIDTEKYLIRIISFREDKDKDENTLLNELNLIKNEVKKGEKKFNDIGYVSYNREDNIVVVEKWVDSGISLENLHGIAYLPEVNKTIGPVKVDNLWCIIEVIEKRPECHESRLEVINLLFEKKLTNLMSYWEKYLRNTFFIEIIDNSFEI